MGTLVRTAWTERNPAATLLIVLLAIAVGLLCASGSVPLEYRENFSLLSLVYLE